MVDFSCRDVHIQPNKQFGLDKNEIKFLHNFSTIGPGNVELGKKEFGYNIYIYKNIHHKFYALSCIYNIYMLH